MSKSQLTFKMFIKNKFKLTLKHLILSIFDQNKIKSVKSNYVL